MPDVVTLHGEETAEQQIAILEQCRNAAPVVPEHAVIGERPPRDGLSGLKVDCAILTDANLTLANLSNANLPFASLFGANLEGLDLTFANLSFADLTFADLSVATLTDANLTNANLTGANLTGANLEGLDLTFANLSGVNLSGTNLSGANLFNASGLTNTSGTPEYDALTNFSDTFFDPVAAGWILIPEPSTALLVGIGLAGIAARRRPATAR